MFIFVKLYFFHQTVTKSTFLLIFCQDEFVSLKSFEQVLFLKVHVLKKHLLCILFVGMYVSLYGVLGIKLRLSDLATSATSLWPSTKFSEQCKFFLWRWMCCYAVVTIALGYTVIRDQPGLYMVCLNRRTQT